MNTQKLIDSLFSFQVIVWQDVWEDINFLGFLVQLILLVLLKKGVSHLTCWSIQELGCQSGWWHVFLSSNVLTVYWLPCLSHEIELFLSPMKNPRNHDWQRRKPPNVCTCVNYQILGEFLHEGFWQRVDTKRLWDSLVSPITVRSVRDSS